jgi:hypothetical protein
MPFCSLLDPRVGGLVEQLAERAETRGDGRGGNDDSSVEDAVHKVSSGRLCASTGGWKVGGQVSRETMGMKVVAVCMALTGLAESNRASK